MIVRGVLPSVYFNPRSSCEERRDLVACVALFKVAFQSTLLMRGATIPRHARPRRRVISIHAPHARSDEA